MDDGRANLNYSVIGAIINPQTYKNIAYLMMSFPLGLLYFLFLVIGTTLGASLSVILIGIPILMFVANMTPFMAEFERRLANALLGTEIGPLDTGIARGAGPIDRTISLFKKPANITRAIYLFLKFPLGLLSFLVSILTVVTFICLFAPLYYQNGDISTSIGSYVIQVDTIGEALLMSLVGLFTALFTLPLISLMAFAWRNIATSMLRGGHDDDYLYEQKRKVVHVGKAKNKLENEDLVQFDDEDDIVDENVVDTPQPHLSLQEKIAAALNEEK
jgi:hypothetical protein